MEYQFQQFSTAVVVDASTAEFIGIKESLDILWFILGLM